MLRSTATLFLALYSQICLSTARSVPEKRDASATQAVPIAITTVTPYDLFNDAVKVEPKSCDSTLIAPISSNLQSIYTCTVSTQSKLLQIFLTFVNPFPGWTTGTQQDLLLSGLADIAASATQLARYTNDSYLRVTEKPDISFFRSQNGTANGTAAAGFEGMPCEGTISAPLDRDHAVYRTGQMRYSELAAGSAGVAALVKTYRNSTNNKATGVVAERQSDGSPKFLGVLALEPLDKGQKLQPPSKDWGYERTCDAPISAAPNGTITSTVPDKISPRIVRRGSIAL